MNIRALHSLRISFCLVVPILSNVAIAYEGHDPDNEVAGPVLGFAMGDTLSFAENHIPVDTNVLGDWTFQGIATGLSFRQTNPVSTNASAYSGFSNAQAIIQKESGPVRVFAQAGLYAIPTLGNAFKRAQPETEGSFGYLPHAYVSLVPNRNWSLAIGKIPSMGGLEATFTFENPNIQRGLLWVQTNSVSRGMQLNFEEGMFSAAMTWNDGAYSGVYNWLGGLASVKPTDSSTYTVSWTGAVSGNSTNTPTTQLLNNNSQITNLIYQYASDRWSISPYAQYTYVPANQSVGINGSSGTYGFAVLSTYHVTPLVNGQAPQNHISIPVRFEYESSYGNSQVLGNSSGLMFGPGSAAWSATLTPTMQWKRVFARAEFSYVKVFNPLAESALGANGLNNNQVRLMLEAGLLY